jgi:hypothetical protein
LLLYWIYEQPFSKNRRAVGQDRKKKHKKRPRCGKKGVEIGSSSGWQSHAAAASDDTGCQPGKNYENDPHVESTDAAGGHA